jgi:hypothetical protein
MDTNQAVPQAPKSYASLSSRSSLLKMRSSISYACDWILLFFSKNPIYISISSNTSNI